MNAEGVQWNNNFTYVIKRGDSGIPILFVPGGPGLPHNYVKNLGNLSSLGFRSVFYDPSGSGKSSLKETPTLETATREIALVFDDYINTREYCLFAHSAGGWIALEAINEELIPTPNKIILASSGNSVPVYLKEARRLLYQMGVGKYLSVWTGPKNPYYKKAYRSFLRSHVLRHPAPEILKQTHSGTSYTAYNNLWGNNESFPDGELQNWQISSFNWLNDTELLATHGSYDHVTVKCSKDLRTKHPNPKLHIFENSAHYPHLEQPKKYKQVMSDFLKQ